MIWMKWSTVFMFLGVALGAFGAHGLRDKLTPQSMEIYKTGVLYHFVHALALCAVAWLSTTIGGDKVTGAGISFISGIILFSGSLYALAVTGIKPLGMITPIGGLAFLLGWLLLFFSVKGIA